MRLPSLSKLCLESAQLPTDENGVKRKNPDKPERTADAVRRDAGVAYAAWLERTESESEGERQLKTTLRRLTTEAIVSSGKDWREVGLTRLLSANALIRFNHGLFPFFGYRTPQYVSVLHDATVVDTAGWHKLVFVRSWMIDRTGGVSRHVMVALRDPATGRMTLVDSNGARGAHAARVRALSNETVDVANTQALQTAVESTALWIEGQKLGTFMGWCSLWSLCVCELVLLGDLTLQGVLWLLNPPEGGESLERVLWTVRESAIRLFHRASTWLQRWAEGSAAHLLLQKPEESQQAVTINGRRYKLTFNEDVVRVGTVGVAHLTLDDQNTEDASIFVEWKIFAGPLQVEVAVPFAPDELVSAEEALRNGLKAVLSADLPPLNEWKVVRSAVYSLFPSKAVLQRVEAMQRVKSALRMYNESFKWAVVRTTRLLTPTVDQMKYEYRDVGVRWRPQGSEPGTVKLRKGQHVVRKAKGYELVRLQKFTEADVRVRLEINGKKDTRCLFGLDPSASDDDVKTLLSNVECAALSMVAPFAQPREQNRHMLTLQVGVMRMTSSGPVEKTTALQFPGWGKIHLGSKSARVDIANALVELLRRPANEL